MATTIVLSCISLALSGFVVWRLRRLQREQADLEAKLREMLERLQ